MKILLSAILLIVLLQLTLYGQEKIDLKKVEIELPDSVQTKGEVLRFLNQKLGLYFSYNTEFVDTDSTLTLETSVNSLQKVLDSLIDTAKAGYRFNNQQVIIFPKYRNDAVNSFIELSGMVVDGKHHKPIPYCNIAISGTGYGAMSNFDGMFNLYIPQRFFADTIVFSCLGFRLLEKSVDKIQSGFATVELWKTNVQLKQVDVAYYDPEIVLSNINKNIFKNYDQNYALYHTFYRETVQENNVYTDVSEAVLTVMKAPYDQSTRQDHVKFIKGRKSSTESLNQKLKFKLQGGPYYLTKLDAIQNFASFLNPEYQVLYTFKFDRQILMDGRPTVVLSFQPKAALNDVFFEGRLFVDISTWAVSRVEYALPKEAMKNMSDLYIQKIPNRYKAVPTGIQYCVDYQNYNGIWYLFSARSEISINVRERKKYFKTKFIAVSEILTTYVERGDFEHFRRHEFFKSSEFLTEKIDTYDAQFWDQYNVIAPDDELEKALISFKNKKLMTTVPE